MMAWMCCCMVVKVSLTRIPLAWLTSNINGDELFICDKCRHIEITELHGNVFKQLTRNVTKVILETHVSHIEPDAFAGLENIKHLTFTG